MSVHAIAGPSSAAMWMACPASITLADGRTRPSSVYAKEGSAAHKIAEMIIGGDLFPPPKLTVEGQEFVIGRDMLVYLNRYISDVQKLLNSGCKVFVEAKVGLSISNGMVWGTADCIGVSGKFLHVLDLKYGKGVPVSPNTPQLKIYALGALEQFGYSRDLILSIYQPRLYPEPQAVFMSQRELIAWRDSELVPAIDRIVQGDTTENAGPHCRWCVRRNECFAYSHQRAGQASDAFDDGQVTNLKTSLDQVEKAP